MIIIGAVIANHTEIHVYTHREEDESDCAISVGADAEGGVKGMVVMVVMV